MVVLSVLSLLLLIIILLFVLFQKNAWVSLTRRRILESPFYNPSRSPTSLQKADTPKSVLLNFFVNLSKASLFLSSWCRFDSTDTTSLILLITQEKRDSGRDVPHFESPKTPWSPVQKNSRHFSGKGIGNVHTMEGGGGVGGMETETGHMVLVDLHSAWHARANTIKSNR